MLEVERGRGRERQRGEREIAQSIEFRSCWHEFQFVSNRLIGLPPLSHQQGSGGIVFVDLHDNFYFLFYFGIY